jgi:hypothetical protein
MIQTFKSQLFSLSSNDFVKALVVAVLSPVAAYVIQVLQVFVAGGSLSFDWKYLGGVALSAAIGYLIKQFGTNSQGQLLTAEPNVAETVPPPAPLN